MTPSPDAGKRNLVASWDTLQRIFIQPENLAVRQVLIKYMEQILFGLQAFLKDHVGITREASLEAFSPGTEAAVRDADDQGRRTISQTVNALNIQMQRLQREAATASSPAPPSGAPGRPTWWCCGPS